MAFDTVATIVSDAAVELGLVSANITDPFASTDTNILQLLRFLKSLGRDLVKLHDWAQLTVTGTITTANGTATYALPTDAVRLIDGTAWNNSLMLPMSPISPRTREAIRATATSSTIDQFYRIGGVAGAALTFEIVPTPTAIQSIKYEYLSSYWVQAAASLAAAPGLAAPAAAGDVCWHDPLLLMRGIKLAFLRAKGFDSTAAQQDFESTLESCMAQDQVSPVLSISGGGEPAMISGDNVPDTGFGA